MQKPVFAVWAETPSRAVLAETEEELWAKACMYQGTDASRSRARHTLMDQAELRADEVLWKKIADHLWLMLDAYDDVAAPVSDHFIAKCPDAVFAALMRGRSFRRIRFRGWRRRAEELIRAA